MDEITIIVNDAAPDVITIIVDDINLTVELNFDFTALLPYTYNVPVAMVLTAQTSEGTAATLSTALGTNMPRYTKLTLTPTAIGLVTLTGKLL